MQTTTIRWRAVNVSRETTTYGASCIGESATAPRCSAPVAWCRQWQTSEMIAPAFWYYCDEHGHAAAVDDGMSLEPNAPGFADSSDPTPGYRYDTASGRWVPDVPASIPSAQLEAELQWTPDAPDATEPAEPNPYAVGSIWNTSRGYDQTNVEFLQVVRESKASVWLVPMGSTIRDGRQWPTTTTGIAKPELHRKPRDAYGLKHPYLTLDYVRSAWPYTGNGCQSTAASGGAGH